MVTPVQSKQAILFAIVLLLKDKERNSMKFNFIDIVLFYKNNERYSIEVNFIGLSVSTQIQSDFQWKLTSFIRSFSINIKSGTLCNSTSLASPSLKKIRAVIYELHFIDNVLFYKKRYSMEFVVIAVSTNTRAVLYESQLHQHVRRFKDKKAVRCKNQFNCQIHLKKDKVRYCMEVNLTCISVSAKIRSCTL